MGGGAHLILRSSGKTNVEPESIYTGIVSKLILPERCGCRPNERNGDKNGAYPEFFHGMYSLNYGVDAGVLYSTEHFSKCAFHLFFSAGAATLPDIGVTSSNKIPVPANNTIYLKTYIENYRIINKVYSDSNLENLIDYFDAPLSTNAFQEMSWGCKINREMTLAVNPRRSTGAVELPADCYFSMAEFTDSRLYMRNGQEVRMTAVNSTVYNPWNSSTQTYEPIFDEELSRIYFQGDLTALDSVVRGEYVSDRCKGSINGSMPY